MIFIPEDKLFFFIKYIVNYIKVDYEQKVDKNETLLYIWFHRSENDLLGVEQMDWYNQAVELFTRDNSHPQKLNIRMHFDADRASIPTIHLNLPSEQTNFNGIGVDKGYQIGGVDELQREFYEINTRAFSSTFQLIISSDNENEVLIIYHSLRAGIISMLDILDVNGIRDPKLGGQDLQFNPMIVPPHIFTRAISISFFYEVDVPSVIREKIVNDVSIEGTPYLGENYSVGKVVI